MSNDRHDDGLVHSHRWATEPPRRQQQPRVIPPRDDHDDGLVHTHGWACGDRGRPSH
jgi:hypothetical protein